VKEVEATSQESESEESEVEFDELFIGTIGVDSIEGANKAC